MMKNIIIKSSTKEHRNRRIRLDFNLFTLKKTSEPTQEEFARAHELAIDLKKRLPPEFTIKGRRYPALRFRADESVPGLYRAIISASDVRRKKDNSK